jgi:hypothetical protein
MVLSLVACFRNVMKASLIVTGFADILGRWRAQLPAQMVFSLANTEADNLSNCGMEAG